MKNPFGFREARLYLIRSDRVKGAWGVPETVRFREQTAKVRYVVEKTCNRVAQFV